LHSIGKILGIAAIGIGALWLISKSNQTSQQQSGSSGGGGLGNFLSGLTSGGGEFSINLPSTSGGGEFSINLPSYAGGNIYSGSGTESQIRSLFSKIGASAQTAIDTTCGLNLDTNVVAQSRLFIEGFRPYAVASQITPQQALANWHIYPIGTQPKVTLGDFMRW
jgi:hypothetical protein